LKLRDDRKTGQIFDAALLLVKDKGLAGITMGEIAKQAGLATGTLYIYFRNKEELINSLFAVCRRASIDSYFAGYDKKQAFKKGFYTVWKNILEYRVRNFDEAVFMDQCYHSPFLNECTKKLTNEMIQPLVQLVEKGKEEGLFKDVDTFMLLSFMIGCIHEGVKKAHYAQQPLNDASIETLFRMCWDGMRR
jgi:AcrR family transcriptional regulator